MYPAGELAVLRQLLFKFGRVLKVTALLAQFPKFSSKETKHSVGTGFKMLQCSESNSGVLTLAFRQILKYFC